MFIIFLQVNKAVFDFLRGNLTLSGTVEADDQFFQSHPNVIQVHSLHLGGTCDLKYNFILNIINLAINTK